MPNCRVEKAMAKAGGTLEGESMAGTFDIMRANDLIFNYVVSNWLLGQDPPVFDILAWNNDSTKMPGTMHAFYLRNFYVRNLLAQGQLEIAGQTIDLSSIKSNAYVVSAKNDHIVPWQSAYKTTQLLSGTTRFVLSNGGHIAGIVNPPGPKSWFLVRGRQPCRGRRVDVHRYAHARIVVGRLGEVVGRTCGGDDKPTAAGLREASRARPRTRDVRLHLRAVAALGRRPVTDPRLGPAPAAAAEARCRLRRRAGAPCAG